MSCRANPYLVMRQVYIPRWMVQNTLYWLAAYWGTVLTILLLTLTLLGIGVGGWSKMQSSFWPVRLVHRNAAIICSQQGFISVPQPQVIAVWFEINKRTEGPITEMYATNVRYY